MPLGVMSLHAKSDIWLRQGAVALAVLSILGQGCSTNIKADTESATRAPVVVSPPPGSMRMRERDGMQTVYVPAGTFEMGSDYLATAYARALCREYIRKDAIAACQQSNFRDESPAHTVTLHAFWIDQTEVTNAQFRKCELAGACEPPIEPGSHYRTSYFRSSEYADFPVIHVTRSHAEAYCAWVAGRLPTEAEWEYAARGPESSIFPWGNTFDGARLNYCDLNCDAGPNDPSVDDGYADTAPVGSYPSGASWIGALDMAGNVREWVADWYGSYTADSQLDPGGPEVGDLIIPRGGSWIDNPSIARSANRGGNAVDYYRDYYGFRCAVDL